ncbi:MAG: aminoacyl-tRNA hydrolase, partial [candidate division NC10 bacterium RBG_16_65_8]
MAAIEDAQWLVAGLGNPGPAYARTRHNVGFAVVERLATSGSAGFSPGMCESRVAEIRLSSTPVLLLKPQTFMNRSGPAVAGWLSRLGLPPARLLVVHDDLDLAVARLRIVTSAGAGGHRGVDSIQESLGTAAFPRIRIGVGRPEAGEDAADRVLADVAPEEAAVLADAVVRAADAVRCLILEGAA